MRKVLLCSRANSQIAWISTFENVGSVFLRSISDLIQLMPNLGRRKGYFRSMLPMKGDYAYGREGSALITAGALEVLCRASVAACVYR